MGGFLFRIERVAGQGVEHPLTELPRITAGRRKMKRLAELGQPAIERPHAHHAEPAAGPGALHQPCGDPSFGAQKRHRPVFEEPNVIEIRSGYPSGDSSSPDDPRLDPQIEKSIREVGKFFDTQIGRILVNEPYSPDP